MPLKESRRRRIKEGWVDRRPVQSSNIRSVGYDQGAMVLEIEFHTGGVYQYIDVPRSVYDGLLRAPSKGSYFHSHIKERYRYRRVR